MTRAPLGAAFAARVALAALTLLGAGCPTIEPIPEPEPFRFKAVHLPGFRLSLDDDASIERLEGAVGPLTMVGNLDVALFGGDAIENADPEMGRMEVDALASTAGILVARSFAVPGPRELAGALPASEVQAELERRGLLPARGTSYATRAARDVRLIVLGPRADAGFLAKALAAGAEPFVVVAAHAVPHALEAALAAEPRVKLVLTGGDAAERPPGGPLYVATPPGRARIVEVHEGALATWLVGAGGAREHAFEASVR